MATALGAAGELVAAREALCAALDARRRRRAARPAGRVHRPDRAAARATSETAHALLAETLAAQPDPARGSRPALRIELANERYFAADWPAMRGHAAAALRAARALDDEALLASAIGMLALADYHVSDVAAARELLGEAAARLDALPDDALPSGLDAALLDRLGRARLARWDGAIATMSGRSGGAGERPGLPARADDDRPGDRVLLAGGAGGRRELAEEAIEAAEFSGNDQLLAWALRRDPGRDDGRLPRPGHRVRRPRDRDLRPALADALGRPRGLRPRRGATRGGRRCSRRPVRCRRWSRPPADRACLQAAVVRGPLLRRDRGGRGRAASLAAAETYVLAAERAAAGLGLPARTGQAQRARAALQLARGDAARAAEAARAAARHSHQAGNALEAARAHLLAGKALARAGRSTEATIALTAALQHAHARRMHDEAALELRRLGRRVARQGRRAARPDHGIEALTDREREVPELIETGHTNRRIAGELHLSPKTVETHVAHIFAKLGVRNRAAAVSAIAHGSPA